MKFIPRNKIFSEFLLYSLAIGINRGSLLLLTPFLLLVFNTGDFGAYNYIQILLQFFGPIVGLNLFVSIAREGAENPAMGVYLEKKFLPYLLLITAGFAIAAFFLDLESFLLFGILLGGAEAWHNMQLSLFRAMDLNWRYFIFTVLKTFGVILIFLILYYVLNIKEITQYIGAQLIWYLLLGIYYQVNLSRHPTEYYPLKAALRFAVVLIPNSIAQWVITGAGRYFLKSMHGVEQLGLFSKAFNLSMVIMLINSGIGLVLPQHLIKNYEKWTEAKTRIRFFLAYSAVSVLTYALVLVALLIDARFFKVYNLNFRSIGFDLLLIYGSLYFLGFYYYYSNILFVLRKNKVISIITVVVSAVTVVLNYFLVAPFNIRGASVSMFFAYVLYLILCVKFANSYEKNKNLFTLKDFLIIFIGLLLCGAFTFLMYMLYE